MRFLAVDGIQKANSGHPGMPMGCAPIAYLLYAKSMKHNPANPSWYNRDRFILSAGHGSMLLYSSLYLSGYKVTLDDLKNFRQWKSITPGHPEYRMTPGVETTTGPLGQGFANAVGMAIAREHLAARFNKDDIKIIDHFIYGICSDGDLMEGISHEAASLAGHLKLSRLIFFYDDNSITIDGSTNLAFSDDTAKRFEAYNWNVLNVSDVNDIDALEDALIKAQKAVKPTLIITKTKIGFGSPNKQGKESSHGSPLGAEEVKLTKQNLGWQDDKFFYVPDDVSVVFGKIKESGAKAEDKWNKLFAKYKTKYPEDAKLFEDMMKGNLGEEWKNNLPVFNDYEKTFATRSISGQVINSLVKNIPGLIGGSADLAPSNNTAVKGEPSFSAENYAGRNFHFGIREHGMASIMNGMAMYGGIIPYGGTFLVFSDYLRPAIRLGSLSGIKVIYVFTHDSIGLGEDGPTHQPVEQIASLRAIPKLIVLRPADANETVFAWRAAIEHKGSPVALILSRQNLPVYDRTKYASAEGTLKGGYILKDCEGTPDIILLSAGSEVSVTLNSAIQLDGKGVKTRIVSMPSFELFDQQSEEYKESVLPKNVNARLSVEAGVAQGWSKYVGLDGDTVSIEGFGASAPQEILMEKYGFSVENITSKAKEVLNKLNT
ncbi:MAG: transketolase [Ignavibacteriaceae bacterium]|nr:transketolase [Ignavibacteriaceae bacterium]